MKVLWLTNIPSPYRVEFFNELGKSCDLTVLFEKKGSDERDSSWLDYKLDNVEAVFLPGKSTGVAEAFCPSVVKWLKKDYDHIVVTNFSDVTGMIAILWLKSHKIAYELESDGGFPGSGKGFKEKIKKFFISGAERYFSTAKIHDQYYMTYGAPSERIVRYPFTSIKEEYILPVCPNEDEKKKLKSILGIKETRCIISVGRFSYEDGYGKGFDKLLDVAELLDDKIGIYIVGDRPTENFLKLFEGREEKLCNVHFVDFQQKDSLFKWYRASDLFVLLSKGEAWGLVLNEAMANGLPVITTEKCVAGLEMVSDGENGYVVPTDITSEKLTNLISKVMLDDGFRASMSLNAIKRAGAYTIETMAENHISEWGGYERG